MARTPLFLLSCLALGACFPVDVWHQTGTTLQRQQADLATCETRAYRVAPEALRVEHIPPRWVPPRQYCQTVSGPKGKPREHCTTRPGYWEPAETYTYDANRNLRRAEFAACMTGRGYARVSLPQCASERMAPGTALPAKAPPVTAESCAVKTSGGNWVVVE